jgi:hypothetical protein
LISWASLSIIDGTFEVHVSDHSKQPEIIKNRLLKYGNFDTTVKTRLGYRESHSFSFLPRLVMIEYNEKIKYSLSLKNSNFFEDSPRFTTSFLPMKTSFLTLDKIEDLIIGIKLYKNINDQQPIVEQTAKWQELADSKNRKFHSRVKSVISEYVLYTENNEMMEGVNERENVCQYKRNLVETDQSDGMLAKQDYSLVGAPVKERNRWIDSSARTNGIGMKFILQKDTKKVDLLSIFYNGNGRVTMSV